MLTSFLSLHLSLDTSQPFAPYGFLFTLEVLHNITRTSENLAERERERKEERDRDTREGTSKSNVVTFLRVEPLT